MLHKSECLVNTTLAAKSLAHSQSRRGRIFCGACSLIPSLVVPLHTFPIQNEPEVCIIANCIKRKMQILMKRNSGAIFHRNIETCRICFALTFADSATVLLLRNRSFFLLSLICTVCDSAYFKTIVDKTSK